MCNTLQNLQRLQWGDTMIEVVAMIVKLILAMIMRIEMVVAPCCTHRNAPPPSHIHDDVLSGDLLPCSLILTLS